MDGRLFHDIQALIESKVYAPTAVQFLSRSAVLRGKTCFMTLGIESSGSWFCAESVPWIGYPAVAQAALGSSKCQQQLKKSQRQRPGGAYKLRGPLSFQPQEC